MGIIMSINKHYSKDEIKIILEREESLSKEDLTITTMKEPDTATDLIPEEFLVSSGDVNYHKIGKILVEKDNLLVRLNKENQKEYEGDSFYARWRRNTSESRKAKIRGGIAGLEETVNSLHLQKEYVPGNFVFTYESGFDGVYFGRTSLFYVNVDERGKKELMTISYSNSFGSEQKILIDSTAHHRLLCVLAPGKSLSKEEIMELKTKRYSYVINKPTQAFPVLVDSRNQATSVFGLISNIWPNRHFEVNGAHCHFHDLEKGNISVQKLVPVFKKSERSHTYRT